MSVEVEKVELSNGDVVEIKPLTMRQAKICKLSQVIKNLMKDMKVEVDEEGNPIRKGGFSIASMIPDEDEVIRVVKVVYPKAEEIPFSEGLDLFWKIINNEVGKLM